MVRFREPLGLASHCCCDVAHGYAQVGRCSEDVWSVSLATWSIETRGSLRWQFGAHALSRCGTLGGSSLDVWSWALVAVQLFGVNPMDGHS